MQISTKTIFKDVKNFINNYQSKNFLPKQSKYFRASKITDAEVISELIAYTLKPYNPLTHPYFKQLSQN